MKVISLLVHYVREVTGVMSLASETRKQIEQMLSRIEQIAKEI